MLSRLDVCGFFLRDEPSYDPPQDLVDFLQAGPEPVYIGFGSIVIEDPAEVTNMIKEASRRLGVRVIVSRGWSKLGGSEPSSDTIFYLGDCPHGESCSLSPITPSLEFLTHFFSEWLFKRVAAVMHHGGAGTTACGLINGQPTSIVPFFGEYAYRFQYITNFIKSLLITCSSQSAFLGLRRRIQRSGSSARAVQEAHNRHTH